MSLFAQITGELLVSGLVVSGSILAAAFTIGRKIGSFEKRMESMEECLQKILNGETPLCIKHSERIRQYEAELASYVAKLERCQEDIVRLARASSDL